LSRTVWGHHLAMTHKLFWGREVQTEGQRHKKPFCIYG
jgi:hypothetical protein